MEGFRSVVPRSRSRPPPCRSASRLLLACVLQVCRAFSPWTAVESPSVEPHRWKTSTSLPRLRLPPLEFGRSIAEPHRWNTLKPSTDVEENGKNFTGGSSSIPLELSRVLSTETVGIRRGNDRNEEKIEETRHKAGINPSSSTLKIPVINDKQIQKA